MSDATRRVQALGNQISPPNSSSSYSSELPKIQKIAGKSAGPRVEGKVVIITGANSPLGIGRASAHQFAENGAKAVYLCDFDGTHLSTHKQEIEALYPGTEVHVRRFDAADEEEVKAVVKHAVDTYGRLDVFFANAGVVGPHKLFADVEKGEFMKVLDTNVARFVYISSSLLLTLIYLIPC